MAIRTLVTGFPRIGEKRELKKALESYWAQKSPREELLRIASDLRKSNWQMQKDAGIDLISVNDFSFYDNMLDTIVMLDAIPPRFRELPDGIDRYFAMARGTDSAAAMEMTKWFNTNYHYIVPELDACTEFKPVMKKIEREYREAKALGIAHPKVNMIGPLTFLSLAKDRDDHDCLDYLDKILPVYQALLRKAATFDSCVYVQMDEPVLVKDPTERLLVSLEKTYTLLSSIDDRLHIIVTTYFEHATESVNILASAAIWGVGLDFVHGKGNLAAVDALQGKKLIAGVVDGRNIWANDLKRTVDLLTEISFHMPKEDVIVSSSCSLLHVPYTVRHEPGAGISSWFSFAREKVDEIVLLAKLFHEEGLSAADHTLLSSHLRVAEERKHPAEQHNAQAGKYDSKGRSCREGTFAERQEIQKKSLHLPLLPTTTIGSFPQTDALRKVRSDWRKGIVSLERYEQEIRRYIDDCVAFQEDIDLDVLVHGEPERTDMVEYFAQLLNGFHITANGWVQSYGSRCVKPPVIYGDVSRSGPMTVKWITYAQSRTDRIMKGMLTGPVTMLNWSFVRDDKPGFEISRQIAEALSEEVKDLQDAGIRIIQVDEAAFKEGYPIRSKNVPDYERWAVENFRLAVRTARKETQIHTHMCYSDFSAIIGTIEAMDADVITIETARSGNRLLQVFREVGYEKGIGPGIYDIHSPRIPSIDELKKQIEALVAVFPVERLWINPDCGLKTRKWDEVKPSLKHMVEATQAVRSS